jgi:hypothetical protein
MKTLIAVVATAIVCAGGAHAYDVAVTPSQFAQLQARVATLEQFDKRCLLHQHLYEQPDGSMAWGIGAPTTHAGSFYLIPDTTRAPLVCYKL